MEHDLIGRTIASYTLLERLGAGGMASVYRARKVPDNKEVALKVLPIHLAASDTLRQRFRREAKMAARLRHPHILPIFDFGEQNGMPYIVMQLVDGGTLDSFVQEGPLALSFIMRVLAEVAAALDHAHSQGVIHRDLKPENILFDIKGTAYLGDFGVARIREGTENLTGDGSFVGTAAYASPEQCRGEELAPVSDIYSLGVVLYEMLTGVLPFKGPTPLAIMHMHLNEPVPNPLRHRPDLPMGINDVIRKALAKLPAVRYQTAGALSDAFSETLQRELGSALFAQLQNAPPIGPNPVFDKPPNAYTPPPPIPDDLLKEITPTQPKRPDQLNASQGRRPHRAPSRPKDFARTKQPAVSQSNSAFYVTLALMLIVLAVVLTALVAMLLS